MKYNSSLIMLYHMQLIHTLPHISLQFITALSGRASLDSYNLTLAFNYYIGHMSLTI